MYGHGRRASERLRRRSSLRITIPKDYLLSRDSPDSGESNQSVASRAESSASPQSAASGAASPASPGSPGSPAAQPSARPPVPSRPVVNFPQAPSLQPQPVENAGGFITIVRPPPDPSNVAPPAGTRAPPPRPPPAPSASSVRGQQPPAASEVVSSISKSIGVPFPTETPILSTSIVPQVPEAKPSGDRAEKQSEAAKAEAPTNTGLGRGTEVGIVLGTIGESVLKAVAEMKVIDANGSILRGTSRGWFTAVLQEETKG